MASPEADVSFTVGVTEGSLQTIASLTPSVSFSGGSTQTIGSPSASIGFSLVCTVRQAAPTFGVAAVGAGLSRKVASPHFSVTFASAEVEALENVEYEYKGDLISEDGLVAIWHWPPTVAKTKDVAGNVEVFYDYSAGSATPIYDEHWGTSPNPSAAESGNSNEVTWKMSISKRTAKD